MHVGSFFQKGQKKLAVQKAKTEPILKTIFGVSN